MNKPTGEIIEGLSYEEYAARPGINASLLNVVDQFSLRHAQATLSGERERDSDALDFGAAFHSLLLEGRTDYVVRPDTYPAPADHAKVKKAEILAGDPLPWTGNANVCKEWAQQHVGKTVFDSAEAGAVEGMVAGLRADPRLSGCLAGRCEISLFVDLNGIQLKARIDTLPQGAKSPVLDFKSTRCARPERFIRSACDIGYHIQAAFYLDMLRWCGEPRDEFWFIPTEKEPPYAHSIVKFRDDAISFIHMGRARYRSALTLIQEAQKNNLWPSYASVEAELYALPYMLSEMEASA